MSTVKQIAVMHVCLPAGILLNFAGEGMDKYPQSVQTKFSVIITAYSFVIMSVSLVPFHIVYFICYVTEVLL